MTFFPWLNQWKNRRTTQNSRRPFRNALSLKLEMLEERTLLSVFTVMNVSDSDPGSLRATVAEASNGDTIQFDPSLACQTIYLTGGEILLSQNLTITGANAADLTISGNFNSRAFEVASGATVTLTDLTISNSCAASGGAIANEGTLTLTGSTLSSNFTTSGAGGGIYNTGSLTVGSSTLYGNSANTFGGGIFNSGTMTVGNSTISTNFGSGGGIYTAVGGSSTLDSTIVADDSTPDIGPDVSGAVISNGHNLISNSVNSTGWVASDLLNVEPELAPLQDNGGPTQTMAPMPGYNFPSISAFMPASPAIDAGESGVLAPTTDQRGENRTAGAGTDIGAVEFQDLTGVTVTVVAVTATFDLNQHGTMAEAYSPEGADLGAATVYYSGMGPTAPSDVSAVNYTATGFFAGNGDYNSAIGTAEIIILPATPTVVVTPVSVTYDGQPHGTMAELLGVGGIDKGPATIAYNTSDGSQPVHAGTYTATGSYDGSSLGTLDYAAATGTATITIAQATPVITWNTPGAITSTTPLSSTQLDATANVAGTFVYSPVAGTVLPAGFQTLSTIFTPTDTTDYGTANASVTLQVNAVSGPGISVSGTTLTIVGGTTSSDQVLVNPAGSSNTGSTGVQVIATLNGVNFSKTFSQQITAVTITLGSGNENIQLAGALTVTVTAGNGKVNLSGANDNVTAVLGDGNDNISLGHGNSSITAGKGADSVNLGNGNDTVKLGNGSDNVSLGDGSDAVTVGNGNDNISLGKGNDAVLAGDGNDNISLGNGSDAVTAGDGNSNINLGHGNDAVTVGKGSNNISLGNGNDAVAAGDGNNNISLGNGSDSVAAGNGKNNICLGNGNDAVTIGNGKDSVGLGNGNDAVTAGAGNDNFTLGNGSDSLVAGNGNDSVNMGNGKDFVTLGDGNDSVNLGNGNDSVTVGNGLNDSVNLGNGNDVVTVGKGNDNISLGNGNDAVTAGNGNDNVYLGNGFDTVTVGDGNDNIGLGDGNDSVTAGNGKDNINLGKGADTVTIGSGNSNISLGKGNSTVVVGNGNDNISMGNGDDVVTAGNGNVSVNLGNGNNTVTLGNGNDSSNLGNGSNVLVEGTGNDNVNAGNGNNLIVAGLGQHSVQVGNGKNILIDGSVTLNNTGDSLRQVLNDWVQNGSQPSNVTSIRSRLSVTDNTSHANRMTAGSGLDWFWATYAKDTLNKKSTDLVN